MLKITNLHVGLEEEDKAILKGVDLWSEPARCMRSWARTGREIDAVLCSVGRDGYEVTGGRPRWTARICWRWSPKSAPLPACFWRSSTRLKSPVWAT